MTTPPSAAPVWRRCLYRVPGVTWSYQQLSRFTFKNSSDYWKTRYQHGGNSGAGSYGRLALFKAETLNELVSRLQVNSVIELGCGDGNQLKLANYPSYIGLDISAQAIQRCIQTFTNDTTKSFYLFDPACCQDRGHLFTADMALSLDVVYHLVEDDIYEAYMRRLFASGLQYVVVYSSNDVTLPAAAHVRHRCITDWAAAHAQDFTLIEQIRNPYPYDFSNPTETSPADFFVYQRNVPHPSHSNGGF